MLDILKNNLVSLLGQWLFKVAGGFLIAHGAAAGDVTQLIAAAVSVLIGVVWSLAFHAKASQGGA
jgi:hypothetical protein